MFLYRGRVEKGIFGWICEFVNLIFSPFTNYIEMFLADRRLRNSKYEDRNFVNIKWMQDQLKLRNRFHGSVSEAWVESQATCRLQMSYYLAFSYIIKGAKYVGVECVALTILGSHKDLITCKINGWYSMPPLLFSAFMSLIAITSTQIMMYKTK